MLNLNELGQMNGSAGGAAGGEDEALPAQHEIGEELKFTGRCEETGEDHTVNHRVRSCPDSQLRPRPCFNRFAGGLWLDFKRKIPWYCSDIYDGFHIQSISAVLFIYLGCITNAITFGGLLGDATDNYQVLTIPHNLRFLRPPENYDS